MNRLFWGLFFCLLDYKVTVGSAVFGLLPDFIGWYLLMKGMEELAGESEHFQKWRHAAFGMVLLSVILYVTDLIDFGSMAAVGVWALNFAALIAGIVVVNRVVAGIRQMEKENRWDLRGERLKALWLILAVMLPVCHLLGWVPLVGSVCNVAALVMGALFLAAFWGSRKMYDQYKKDPQ